MTLQKVLQPYGRSPKELVYDFEGEAVSYLGTTPDVDVAFKADFGSGGSNPLTNLPSAEGRAYAYGRCRYDARWATHVRLVIDMEVAGASGTKAKAYYLPNYTAAPTTTADPVLAGELPLELDIDATGLTWTGWRQLDTASGGPQRDVVWELQFSGGDGAADPKIGRASLQFRYQPVFPLQNLFFRQVAPSSSTIIAAMPTLSVPEAQGWAENIQAISAALEPPGFTDFVPPFWSYSVNPNYHGSLLDFDPVGADHGEAVGCSTPGGMVRAAYDYYTNHFATFVSPPIAGGQALPAASSVRVAYKHGIGAVWHQWLVFRVGLWRPSTSTWIGMWSLSLLRDLLFRRNIGFHNYEYEIVLDGGAAVAETQDDDRWVAGVGGASENTSPPYFNDGGSGVQLQMGSHNGADPYPVQGGDSVLDHKASYISVPQMDYLDTVA